MKVILPSIFLVLIVVSTGFKENQLKYQRVKNAYDQKEEGLKTICKNKDIEWENLELFFRALKKERRFEVWAKNKNESEFLKLIEYPFCAFSGKLGPKRKQGDFQIPEGVYFIDRYNPLSNFHLSLGINYPNKADKLNSKSPRGGDIFIHGDCQTIGCIPLTDDKIKELYVLAVQAKENGQSQIPIHIFPFDFSTNKINEMIAENQLSEHRSFWNNLSKVYNDFETKRILRTIDVNSSGHYILK